MFFLDIDHALFPTKKELQVSTSDAQSCWLTAASVSIYLKFDFNFCHFNQGHFFGNFNLCFVTVGGSQIQSVTIRYIYVKEYMYSLNFTFIIETGMLGL